MHDVVTLYSHKIIELSQAHLCVPQTRSTLHAIAIRHNTQRKQRWDPPPTPCAAAWQIARAHTHSQCSSSFTIHCSTSSINHPSPLNGSAYIASRSAAWLPHVTRPKRKWAVKIGVIASRRPVAGASPTTTRSKGRRRLLLGLGRKRRKLTTVAPAPEREAVGRNEKKERMASNGVAGEEDAVEAMETEMSPEPNGIKVPPTVTWGVSTKMLICQYKARFWRVTCSYNICGGL